MLVKKYLKKEDICEETYLKSVLQKYYDSIGRGDQKKRPSFEDYTIKQLYACIGIHRIKIVYNRGS